jgi:hypothetical protein
MSIYAGPDIADSGLTLCLDAGNPVSYPGSGTTWRDVSGQGNNGILVDGPTFNSANGGVLVFTGAGA